jgi:uncharacterized membrane protein
LKEGKDLMKCEYCGEKIGLLAVRYTWLDKPNKRAMHDKCYEIYKKEQTEKIEQTDEEKQVQKEETKPLEKMMKSKIIGVVLIIFTSCFLVSYFYSRFVLRTEISTLNIILTTILYAVSLLVGMELVTIKKDGIYNKFLLICGIIPIVIYSIWLITIVFDISLW